MIYVFLANGFEETEALTTVDILRRAALEVQTVGIGGRRVCGCHQIVVEADLSDEEVAFDGLTGIVLPGGMPGTRHLEMSPCVQACIDYAAERDLWIAAICAAPSLLGKKGLLAGKRATCFPGYEDTLTGATVCADRVVRDGKIITGKGAGATIPFALEIVSRMVSLSKAEAIGSALQCAPTP